MHASADVIFVFVNLFMCYSSIWLGNVIKKYFAKNIIFDEKKNWVRLNGTFDFWTFRLCDVWCHLLHKLQIPKNLKYVALITECGNYWVIYVQHCVGHIFRVKRTWLLRRFATEFLSRYLQKLNSYNIKIYVIYCY